MDLVTIDRMLPLFTSQEGLDRHSPVLHIIVRLESADVADKCSSVYSDLQLSIAEV
jgi:hypothetical protein